MLATLRTSSPNLCLSSEEICISVSSTLALFHAVKDIMDITTSMEMIMKKYFFVEGPSVLEKAKELILDFWCFSICTINTTGDKDDKISDNAEKTSKKFIRLL